MVVCRFFQQGYCWFGQNCRNEHIYSSKYTYNSNQTQQSTQQQPAGCTDEQLVNQVQADVQSALRGGQWILSFYAPFSEKPIFPGISDLSPEEARLFIYEAKSNNTIEQAVSYMNNLFQETKQKYEQLLHPNVNIIKVLRSIYKGEVVSSPFSDTAQNTFAGANDTASSVFRSAVQNSQQSTQSNNTEASIFNQGQSIFNTQQDPAKELFSRANNTSIFAPNQPIGNVFRPTTQNDSVAKSIFATAVQNTDNPFKTTQQTTSSIFSPANQSIFAIQPTHNSSPFTQVPNTSPFQQNTSPFNQSQNMSPFSQGNVFQKADNPASIFGQANKQLTTDDPGVYSKMEELSQEDLEAYNSAQYELGFVPELPPAHQLCV